MNKLNKGILAGAAGVLALTPLFLNTAHAAISDTTLAMNDPNQGITANVVSSDFTNDSNGNKALDYGDVYQVVVDYNFSKDLPANQFNTTAYGLFTTSTCDTGSVAMERSWGIGDIKAGSSITCTYVLDTTTNTTWSQLLYGDQYNGFQSDGTLKFATGLINAANTTFDPMIWMDSLQLTTDIPMGDYSSIGLPPELTIPQTSPDWDNNISFTVDKTETNTGQPVTATVKGLQPGEIVAMTITGSDTVKNLTADANGEIVEQFVSDYPGEQKLSITRSDGSNAFYTIGVIGMPQTPIIDHTIPTTTPTSSSSASDSASPTADPSASDSATPTTTPTASDSATDSPTTAPSDSSSPTASSSATNTPSSSPTSSTSSTATTTPVKTTTLTGVIFDDKNSNGTQDTGENSTPGAKVELLDAKGTLLNVVSTDSNGSFTISNVVDGNYILRATNPTTGVTTEWNVSVVDGVPKMTPLSNSSATPSSSSSPSTSSSTPSSSSNSSSNSSVSDSSNGSVGVTTGSASNATNNSNSSSSSAGYNKGTSVKTGNPDVGVDPFTAIAGLGLISLASAGFLFVKKNNQN